jgi:hypothetical protein
MTNRKTTNNDLQNTTEKTNGRNIFQIIDKYMYSIFLNKHHTNVTFVMKIVIIVLQ